MVLTAPVLAIMRHMYERNVNTVNYTRAVLNGIFQGIEDYLVGSFSARPANSLSAAINAAGGSAMSTEERRVAGAIVCYYRAEREGIT